MIYRVLYIPGGAGFLPSTVWRVWLQWSISFQLFFKVAIFSSTARRMQRSLSRILAECAVCGKNSCHWTLWILHCLDPRESAQAQTRQKHDFRCRQLAFSAALDHAGNGLYAKTASSFGHDVMNQTPVLSKLHRRTEPVESDGPTKLTSQQVMQKWKLHIPCVKGSKMSFPPPVIPTASFLIFLCLVVRIDSLYRWLRWCRHLQQLTKSVGSELIPAASETPRSQIDPLAVCSPWLEKAVWLKLFGKAFEPKEMDPTESTEEILGI